MTTVSVIIPTWNRSALLPKAIRSALAQTLPPLEVLVCDDGSTDDTEAVVGSFDDSRLVWLPGERAGRPAVPRNRGIAASRGEWVAFLDDDDVWYPEKLEKQVALAKQLGCQAVCGNAVRLVPGQETNGNLLDCHHDRFSFEHLLTANFVICSSAMMHRSLFADVGGFPPSPALTTGEDYALWLRVATKTDFAYCAEPLLDYRDDPAYSVRANGVDDCTQKRRALKDFIGWADGTQGDRAKTRAAKRLLRRLYVAEAWKWCRRVCMP
ncbi:glycosyltransferase family 2 protein [Trichlorobacter ammonificans]|uniref:Glyco_trans_2-like domain-containing protein n=1 Tax=Trichlorobacter ammonificans TaxID=2916410 RepID=A0ABM9D8N1_9BACT|nr:glycosyltransferase family 2 protein [Trichlorobacter ammonificans]CAH2031083.1 Glyco_trans_2-like domain-containing protein [Trichlorobacter ammonificans]